MAVKVIASKDVVVLKKNGEFMGFESVKDAVQWRDTDDCDCDGAMLFSHLCEDFANCVGVSMAEGDIAIIKLAPVSVQQVTAAQYTLKKIK